MTLHQYYILEDLYGTSSFTLQETKLAMFSSVKNLSEIPIFIYEQCY